jgi:hypothetical protein
VAGRARLSVRPSIRFAGVIAIVIALHAWVLQWLSNALEGPAHLKPMAAPMFTRLLKPEAPAAHPAPATKAPPARNHGVMVAASPAARPASAAASRAVKPAQPPATEVAQSTPQAVTQTLPLPTAASGAASAPQAAASAPAVAASAPASASSSVASSTANAIVNASGDTWPADTRLTYRLSGWYRGELTGTARVQWQRPKKDAYETRVDLDLGVIGFQFLSQGTLAGDTLAPRAYQESTPRRTRIVQLGPENVVLNDGRTVGKPAGVQDTASQFVELSHRFSTGREKLVVGGSTSVWLARPGGVDLWTYDIVGLDLLRTRELGVVAAYHLKPRPIHDARGDIYAEIWLAPTLQYLPVRIRITQPPDSYVDILVDRIEQR